MNNNQDRICPGFCIENEVCQMAIPEMVMMIGLPASGKSTLALEYEKKGYHIPSSDAIRRELYGFLDQRDPNRVFQLLQKRVREDLKKGISCVYDATNIHYRYRTAYLAEIKSIPCIKTAAVVMAPPGLVRERNLLRGEAVVPDDIIEKMLRSYHAPYYHEGWDRIELIPGCDLELIREDAKKNDGWEPEKMVEIGHDNHHHPETIGQHMLMAEAYAKEHGFSELVRIAARYHDIGKPYTKAFFNYKGEPTEEAHFYGHESVSAYFYLLKALAEGMETDPALYVAAMISLHMRPLHAWNNSEKMREVDGKLLGETLYEDVWKLNACDKNARLK